METELRQKLQNDLMLGFWKDIKPQVHQGIVFAVLDYDLIEAGIALAQDDASMVRHLLNSGQLQRVSASQSEQLPDTQHCRFLIVRPYVLIQVVATK